ncbi:MAG: EF-P lysine aminoacylase EpmA [Pseudomonadota bacterium]
MIEAVPWRPRASNSCLRARAKLNETIRAFFAEREVLEVETPLLARHTVTDPNLEPLAVETSQASKAPRYLQTSPEFAMKRLLASGSGSIFQLCKAFRDGELGHRHNPEFTMLEWYRPHFTMVELMDEVAALVDATLGESNCIRMTYRDAFRELLAIDPWECSRKALLASVQAHTSCRTSELDRDSCLDLLLSHCIEPEFANRGRVFLYDYPPSQAALAACAMVDGVQVAKRFELYVDGIELANGYQELLDAAELKRRVRLDNQELRTAGRSQRLVDPQFEGAMQHGLPDCAGVALGVDRLLMLTVGKSDVRDVLAFDWLRA